MPSPAFVVSVAWFLAFYLRLSASNPRNVRRKSLFQRMRILVDQYESGRPLSYCRLNRSTDILRLWFNPEADLKADFRLSRRAIQGLPRLLETPQDHGWGHQLEVLVYVYWLANAVSYRTTARLFGIPRSTVHRIVNKVAPKILRNLKHVIRFPQPGELAGVAQGFRQKSGSPAFSNVVGAIDGCHVRIKPPSLHKIDYLNYKGFFSVNMQAICDSTGRFLDIFVGYPGSVHDTRIMKNSTFYTARQYPPPGYILLGDGGYPCLDAPISLITPYKEPVQGRDQRRFNYFHSKGRNVIERSFGMMKTRWRTTLFKALEVKHTFAPTVIATCAFLHNVCMDNGDIMEPDADVNRDVLEPRAPHELLTGNERSGNATRDRMAALVAGHQ